MRIIIDINHPAHVHYFRNFIRIMEERGHSFRVINRDSKMINYLLDSYGIAHVVRNPRPGKKGTFSSLRNLMVMVRYCMRESRTFHPDLYLGFGSSACAITSFLFRKPCVLLDDTEHNTMNHRLYKPFADRVLTPFYFKKSLWKKPSGRIISDEGRLGADSSRQLTFNAYVEQLYLHSNYFAADANVPAALGLEQGKYVLVRYIAYDAHHDLSVNALDPDTKKRLVNYLAGKYRVVLSLESEEDRKDPDFAPFLLDFPPDRIHDIMAGAAFVLTEGATMASEAFVLGVPYIYMNPLEVGNVDSQCGVFPDQAHKSSSEAGIMECIGQIESVLASGSDVFGDNRRSLIERNHTDPTRLLVDYVESNYGAAR